MKNFTEFCQKLENKIKASYEEGVTLDQAEKLAAEFLYAQMVVSAELKNADLDSRMKKIGLKAIEAATYTLLAEDTTKKRTVDAIKHAVNAEKLVQTEQSLFDTSEVYCDELTRYYQIFREAHIYYRGISKGKFE